MKKVTIYSTPTCPFCNQAKAFLTEKGVEFTNIDVSVDAAKAQEMIDKSGQMGVPVLDIENEIIVGFDREKISKILGIE